MTLEAARQRVNLALGLPLDATPPEEIEVYSEAVDQSPEVRGALLAVQAAEEELSHTRITAPSGGFITGLSLNPGDLVSQEVPLCRIESLDEMIAEITIDEVDIGKIALGDHVRITTDSLIGETLEGQVLSIAPVVERIGNLRAAVVKVSIDQEDRFLRAGASCLVKIDVRASQADVVIPVTGFFTQTGAIWVYKIAQGPTAEGESGDWVYTLEKTEIELGRSSLDEAVVTQGLVPGDRIAVGDLSSLRDGITVIPASQDLAEEDAQSGGETG